MIHPYSNDELIKLMDAAPVPIQKAIESHTTTKTISGLGTRMSLHIDVIGKIADLNVRMLLGLITENEFLQELVAIGIFEKDAREIITEINQKIFIPLREEMEHGAATAVKPAPQAPDPVRVVPAPVRTPPAPERLVMPADLQPLVPPPAAVVPETPPPPPPAAKPSSLSPKYVPEYAPGTYAPPPQSPRYPQQEDAAAYIHHVAPLPQRQQVNKIQPTPAKSAPAVPPKPREITDRARLLEEHEEGHIDFPALPRAVARVAPPPPNLPGTFPEHLVSVAEPIAQKPLQTRPYTVDPYREPLEEGK